MKGFDNFDNTAKISITRHKKKEFVRPNHSHPYYELLYARDAAFSYFIGDEIIFFSSHDVILVDKDTVHKAIDPDSGTQTYFLLQFYGSCIDDSVKDSLHELFKHKHLALNNNEYMLIDLLISKMQREFEGHEHNREVMVTFQLNELIELLYRISLNVKETEKNDPNIIEQAITYINDNFLSTDKELLSLQYVSAKFFMSPSYFSKLFKKTTGLGFKEYILTTKITHAKKLLSSTDYPITKIAFESGFNDSNYFASVFKKIESISPSDYSKLIKNNR